MRYISFIITCYLLISCSYRDDTLPISFPDPMMERCVRANLNPEPGEYFEGEIYQDMLDEMTRFGCYGNREDGFQIKDITGVELMHNITYLSFKKHPLNDNSNTHLIGELTQLRSIYIEDSEISDISFFKGLYNLERVSLWDNAIEDISPIANLRKLGSIELSHNNISDSSLVIFNNFVKLGVLNLDYNNITDITLLKDMKNVISLGINHNSIKSLEPLRNNQTLIRLSAEYNYIEDVSVLSTIPTLEDVWIAGNCIEDFSSVPDGVIVHGDDRQDLSRCE